MDPDADLDPAIFVSDLQHIKQKKIISVFFFAYFFLKVNFSVADPYPGSDAFFGPWIRDLE